GRRARARNPPRPSVSAPTSVLGHRALAAVDLLTAAPHTRSVIPPDPNASRRPRPGKEHSTMRRARRLTLTAISLGVAVTALTPAPALGQAKKLVYWTHWEQNPDFNKWYEAKGKEFAKTSGYEVEVVTIPYQGYEAKYLAALMGKTGAPDFFNGMTHQ